MKGTECWRKAYGSSFGTVWSKDFLQCVNLVLYDHASNIFMLKIIIYTQNNVAVIKITKLSTMAHHGYYCFLEAPF